MLSIFEKSKNVNADQRGDTISYILRAMVARSKDGVINIAPGIAKRILETAGADSISEFAEIVRELPHDEFESVKDHLLSLEIMGNLCEGVEL